MSSLCPLCLKKDCHMSKNEILRLLDIRYGRANRLQFLVGNLILFFALYTLEGLFLGIPSLIGNYLTFILFARRLRDINMSGKYLYLIIGIFLILLFLAVFLPSLQTQSDVLTIIYISVSGAFILLLLVFPPVLSGNQYGPQPQGLDFRTMRAPKNET